jgi:hypothetical protein
VVSCANAHACSSALAGSDQPTPNILIVLIDDTSPALPTTSGGIPAMVSGWGDAKVSRLSFRNRGRKTMKRVMATRLAGLYVAVTMGLAMFGGSLAVAATPPKPTISEDARAAVAQMGKTLLAKDFSFQARTIRPYANDAGVVLHIEHDFKIVVHRPDRLLMEANGDDGPRKLYYDGKTVTLALDASGTQYATLPVPDTITMMMHVVMGRFGLDFPLADFLTDAPDKAFLQGVTSGRVVNKVMIDGVPCVHLVFSQPPGLELELWLEADRGVPRRLIVIDNSSPSKPNFVAEMSDWDFAVHPADSDFVFTPPNGAKEMDFGAALSDQHIGAPQ